MLNADFSNRFKKDYKTAMKRGFDISLLDSVIEDLINEEPLSEKYRDHTLTGSYEGCREWPRQAGLAAHLSGRQRNFVFERTGSHSDLF